MLAISPVADFHTSLSFSGLLEIDFFSLFQDRLVAENMLSPAKGSCPVQLRGIRQLQTAARSRAQPQVGTVLFDGAWAPHSSCRTA